MAVADAIYRQRTTRVREQALALGFDACDVASASVTDPQNALGQWLDSGYHADMHWMERTKAIRQDVRKKVPGAESVIVLARNYHSPRPPEPHGSGKVAAYAWGRDYHRVLKKPLDALVQFLQTLEKDVRSYGSIDSGPVMERTWAARSGLAAIGKNSLALRRDLGSWFFLATIVTTLRLEAGKPAADLCGTCTRCIDACPTQAIVAPGVVDSRRCISYHTIENRNEIPEDIRKSMGPWVFGCDVCQEVCPWNRFATQTSETDFSPRPEQANPLLPNLLAMDQNEFKETFSGTPIMRAKHKGMKRNAQAAMTKPTSGDA